MRVSADRRSPLLPRAAPRSPPGFSKEPAIVSCRLSAAGQEGGASAGPKHLFPLQKYEMIKISEVLGMKDRHQICSDREEEGLWERTGASEPSRNPSATYLAPWATLLPGPAFLHPGDGSDRPLSVAVRVKFYWKPQAHSRPSGNVCYT